jgi:hypothetical protein
MCALVVERLCHLVMGQIPTLECLLPRARGFLWSCNIMSGIQCRYLLWALPYQLFLVLKALGRGYWGPGYIPSQVTNMICDGLTCGEIQSFCAYREEMEERVVPRSNFFR